MPSPSILWLSCLLSYSKLVSCQDAAILLAPLPRSVAGIGTILNRQYYRTYIIKIFSRWGASMLLHPATGVGLPVHVPCRSLAPDVWSYASLKSIYLSAATEKPCCIRWDIDYSDTREETFLLEAHSSPPWDKSCKHGVSVQGSKTGTNIGRKLSWNVHIYEPELRALDSFIP